MSYLVDPARLDMTKDMWAMHFDPYHVFNIHISEEHRHPVCEPCYKENSYKLYVGRPIRCGLQRLKV